MTIKKYKTTIQEKKIADSIMAQLQGSIADFLIQVELEKQGYTLTTKGNRDVSSIVKTIFDQQGVPYQAII